MTLKKSIQNHPIITKYESRYLALEETQRIFPLVFSSYQASRLLQEYISVQLSGKSNRPLRTIPLPGKRRFSNGRLEDTICVMAAIVDKILQESITGADKIVNESIHESSAQGNEIAEIRLRIFARIMRLRKDYQKRTHGIITAKSNRIKKGQGSLPSHPIEDPTYSSAIKKFKQKVKSLQENRSDFLGGFKKRLRELSTQKIFISELKDFASKHSEGEKVDIDAWYAILKKYSFVLVDRIGNTLSPVECMSEISIEHPTIENFIAYITSIIKRKPSRNVSKVVRGPQKRFRERRRLFEERLQVLRNVPDFLIEMGSVLSYSSKRKSNFYQNFFELCRKYELFITPQDEKYHPQAYYTTLFSLKDRKLHSLVSYILGIAPEIREFIPKRGTQADVPSYQIHTTQDQ